MSMRNFAAALSGGLNAIVPGMMLGEQIENARDKKAIKRIEAQGMDLAREQNKTDTYDSKVQTFNPQGKGGAPTTYGAGGKNFRDQGEAAKNVKTDVSSVIDNYMKNTAPKIAEEYLAQGKVEKAEAWNNYIKGREGQKAMEDWSKGYLALGSGDWDGGAKAFGKYYTDYVNDNVDYKGHELVKDNDGNVTGFKLKLFDNDVGKEMTMPMSTGDMIRMGAASNPGALFEMAAKQESSANEMRAKTASEIAKEERAHKRALQLKNVDQEFSVNNSDRDFANKVDLKNIEHVQAMERDASKTTRGSGAPADVQTVEWMVANKVAPNKEAGWKLLQRRTDMTARQFATEYAKMAAEAQDPYGDKKTPEQLLQDGMKLYDSLDVKAAPIGRNAAAGGLPQWDDTVLQSRPNLPR